MLKNIIHKLKFKTYYIFFRGGYLVRPEAIEFWQGQTNRIHDRIRFRKRNKDEIIDSSSVHEGEDGWLYERLSP